MAKVSYGISVDCQVANAFRDYCKSANMVQSQVLQSMMQEITSGNISVQEERRYVVRYGEQMPCPVCKGKKVLL